MICLEPHFAIKDDAGKQKYIIKEAQCVPLPALLMLEHPDSIGRFIVIDCNCAFSCVMLGEAALGG